MFLISYFDNKTKIDKVSIDTIANSDTDAIKNWFTSEDNKPATKGDLKAIIAKLKERYIKIKSMPIQPNGTQAFFDIIEQEIVYFKVQY